MPFIASASAFFKSEKKERKIEEAQLVLAQFYREDFEAQNIRSALMSLQKFSQEFELSLPSAPTIEKVKKVLDKASVSLSQVSGIFYGLTECGFSAQHFSSEQKKFFARLAINKIAKSNADGSEQSTPSLTSQIALLSSLKNLGLLDDVSIDFKGEVAAQLRKIFASTSLMKLRESTHGALIDFCQYANEVVKIATPDFAQLEASLPEPQAVTSLIQVSVFGAIREYLAKGLSATVKTDEWSHKGKKLASTALEKNRFSIGEFVEVVMESRVLNKRSFADIVITDNSQNPPKRVVVEVDGKTHGAWIDGSFVPNGKSLARNKMLKKKSGEDVVVIGVESFDKFAYLRSGTQFCSTIPALGDLRERLAQDIVPAEKAQAAVVVPEVVAPEVVEEKMEPAEPAAAEKAQAVVVPEVAAAEVFEEKREEAAEEAAAGNSKKKKKKKKPAAAASDKEQQNLTLDDLLSHHGSKKMDDSEFLKCLEQLVKEEELRISRAAIDIIITNADFPAFLMMQSFPYVDESVDEYLESKPLSGATYLLIKILKSPPLSHAEKVVPAKSAAAERMQKTLKEKLKTRHATLKTGLPAEAADYLDFALKLYEDDPVGAVMDAIRQGELRQGELKLYMASLSEDADEIFCKAQERLSKEHPEMMMSPKVLQILFCTLQDIRNDRGLVDLYLNCCQCAFINRDADYLSLILKMGKSFHDQMGENNRFFLLRDAVINCDSVEMLEMVLERGAPFFSKEGTKEYEFELVASSANFGNTRVLEFLLDKYSEDPERLAMLKKQSNRLIEIVSDNPAAVKTLFDHGFELNEKELSGAITNCAKLGQVATMYVLQDKYPQMLNKELGEHVLKSSKRLSPAVQDFLKNLEDLSPPSPVFRIEGEAAAAVKDVAASTQSFGK